LKAAILAGGLGTRLCEETAAKAKCMVAIGGKPILWHIMKGYATFGDKEFVIALGYKGDVIKDYFLNYRVRSRSLIVDLASGNVTIQDGQGEDWVVHLLDTGLDTTTGGRGRRVARYIGHEPFMLTYGDGVCNLDVGCLVHFHRLHGKLATVRAVRPGARFGGISFDGHLVTHFEEKPQVGEGWINGGFFVFEPGVADYITNDDTILEKEPLERLAAEGQLVAYRHDSFWQCLVTLRDVRLLETLWGQDNAPWRVWE
jgi:glucose-1-phosphate cytidylyltransferase